MVYNGLIIFSKYKGAEKYLRAFLTAWSGLTVAAPRANWPWGSAGMS